MSSFIIGDQGTSVPVSPIATTPEAELATLLKRGEQFQLYNQELTTFMRELLVRHEYLHEQNQVAIRERDDARTWALKWREEQTRYEKVLNTMERVINDNSCVTVLIDGDGMIFLDDFLREGEQGGRRAASALHAAVYNFIEHEAKDMPLHVDIICRVYANVRGLSEVLVRAGITREVSMFEEFVRGFTRGKTLFDFIDVGAGKDRADEKIIGSLKRNVKDYQCRRIFFGCSHDNGYARTLEKYIDKADVLNKVILLEGVPFEKELVLLPYATKKFNGIFRAAKINTWDRAAAPTPVQQRILTDDSSAPFHTLSGLPSRFSSHTLTPTTSILDSPIPATPNMLLPRTPSDSTLASDGFPALKPIIPMHSWASKAAAPPPPVSAVPVYKPANREEVIARNRAGQRVDPPCKDYDKSEVDRIKKIKMCNVHFLRKECPFDTNCTHLHAYKPTEQEIATLRLVARMAPCVNGSGCHDIKCIYGHCCPAPLGKTAVKGTKSCIFGELCKFPIELHDIDRNVVKTLVIR